ncbi:MAG: DUF3626 domain-containing protein [Verrucomicrobia bacterium]|nr:MAG: DUF3626 domain-containing protein [Verrucomicrobiota bacterium]
MKPRNWIPLIGSPQEKAIRLIREKFDGEEVPFSLSVTINFHPDRITPSGFPVLEAIQSDGLVKSQFESGMSNGSLSAYEGGARWKWEQSAFFGFYDNCAPFERPKYGSLDRRTTGGGGSPRFGSSYFRLKLHVLERTTFCYPDSFFEPKNFCVANKLSHVVQLADLDDPDLLDDYIEAHIHGPIDLERDVDELVLDPVYKKTFVRDLADKLPCDVAWHSGFATTVDVIERHPDYRGREIVSIAKDLSKDGRLDPFILGQAVESGAYDPQAIRKVWHYLARFGNKNNQP